jgi:hypothetical protein
MRKSKGRIIAAVATVVGRLIALPLRLVRLLTEEGVRMLCAISTRSGCASQTSRREAGRNDGEHWALDSSEEDRARQYEEKPICSHKGKLYPPVGF